MNDGPAGAPGGGGAPGSSKAAPRRKSESGRANGNVGGSGGKAGKAGKTGKAAGKAAGGAERGGGGGGGHERSSSLGQHGLLAGMTPAAAAAAAAVTAVAAGGRGGGHDRTGSGQLLMGQRGDGMTVEKQEWIDGPGRGSLPSLDSVTGGLRNLPGGRQGGAGGAEVRHKERFSFFVLWVWCGEVFPGVGAGRWR